MYDAYRAILFDLFGTLVNERAEAIPGAREALSTVPSGRWAIVTSCGTRLARSLIANAGLPVPDVIISSDDVARSKPAPDPYLLAAKQFRIDPSACLVIEDSVQGVQAAIAAGMDVVVVKRGRAAMFPQRATVVESIASLRFEEDEAGAIRVAEVREDR